MFSIPLQLNIKIGNEFQIVNLQNIFTKSREFIKEAEPPAPDGDGHGVRGQPEGHLRSEGQEPPTGLG